MDAAARATRGALQHTCHASVDVENLAGDEVASRAAEESQRAYEIFDIAPAPGRCVALHPGRKGLVLHERCSELGPEIPGRDGVDLDPSRPQIGAHSLRQLRESTLGR